MVDINSCDTDKILHAFKEIGNFIGSNNDGFGYQVQQAFLVGVYYDWVAAETQDPCEKVLAAVDEEATVCVKLEDVSNLSIIISEVQAKNHALKEIKYADSCVKLYSWIWTLYT